MISTLPPYWTDDQRRRLCTALLAFSAAPGPDAEAALRAAAPEFETAAVAFGEQLVEHPRSGWHRTLRRLGEPAGGEPAGGARWPGSREEGTSRRVADLFRNRPLARAFLEYLDDPGSPAHTLLEDLSGGDDPGWLIRFADALRRFPSGEWHETVELLRTGMALAEVGLARRPQAGAPQAGQLHYRLTPTRLPPRQHAWLRGVRQPGARQPAANQPAANQPAANQPAARPPAPRHPVAPSPAIRWAMGAAAAACLAVAGAASYVVTNHFVHRQAPGATTWPASWRVAGAIYQPAWKVSPDAFAARSPVVTCTTRTTCVATDPTSAGENVIEVTTDGGTTWASDVVPDQLRLTSPLVCLSPHRCIAGAFSVASTGARTPVVATTTEPGPSWTSSPLPAGVGSMTDLACPSQTTCIGVGFDALAAGSPTPQGLPVALTTDDGGRSWSVANLPHPFHPVTPGGISCASTLDCAFVGTTTLTTAIHPTAATGAVLVTTDGGRDWAPVALPTDVGPVWAVSCSAAGSCLAAADDVSNGVTTGRPLVFGSEDPGQPWHSLAGQGLTISAVGALSCSSATDCWIGGSQLGSAAGTPRGVIAGTHDGGAHWQDVAIPSELSSDQQQALRADQLDLAVVSSLSCPDATTCVSLGVASTSSNSGVQVVLQGTGS